MLNGDEREACSGNSTTKRKRSSETDPKEMPVVRSQAHTRERATVQGRLAAWIDTAAQSGRLVLEAGY
jgi:hypothetical protein